MNILIFTDTYTPQINGLVTSVNVLKAGLEKLHHTVYIVAPGKLFNSPTEKNIIYIPSIPYIFLPEYRTTFLFSFKLIKLMNKVKFDIIHTHTPFSLGITGALMGKFYKIPVVHTYHTYFEEYIHYLKLPKFIGRAIAKYFSKWYCNLTNSIIVPSSFMKAVLKSYKINKSINVIPTGINIAKFNIKNKNLLRNKYTVSKNTKLLLYAGRLAKEKNLYLLLDILKDLKEKYDEIKLMFVGDGPEKTHLHKYAKHLNILNNIIFTGYVARDKIKNFYAASTVFVFPSLTETQGLVLLESMASGIPIVSLYKRGTKSVLPKNKLIGISPVRNKIDFINEIIFYLTYKNNNRIKNNLKKFVHKFHYLKLTREMLRLYTKVINAEVW